MTALSTGDFIEFFKAVHDGATPFPWQIRLVERLLTTKQWPAQIVAPTGAGKTVVIDAHVFAIAALADRQPETQGPTVRALRLPRRLALVVPRRALVDSQYEHACRVAELLRDATDTSSVLGRVAAALRSLRWQHAPPTGRVPGSPLIVTRLRGGLPAPRAWLDDPTACAVLSATPDMWGSRLLFHGYGDRDRARPRAAGLLAFDTVVVNDEAHLTRQLVETARAVATLERSTPHDVGAPRLQVVETTATPTSGHDDVLSLDPSDLTEPALTQRLSRPKQVTLHESGNWPASDERTQERLVEEIADHVVTLRSRVGSRHDTHSATVGIFVNTVRLAVKLTKTLRERTQRNSDDPLNVVLVCGRLRGYDVRNFERDFPGIFTLHGNSDVDVLISTQSLEVGVDLDLAGAIAELAPAQALAQRAGRVNRLGSRSEAELIVIGPEASDALTGTGTTTAVGAGPYALEDLATAWQWLRRRSSDPQGLSPLALLTDPPPSPSKHRSVFQRVELADSWWLARTVDELDPDIDLDLWLEEDLRESPVDVGIVVREAMPDDPAEAVELIRTMPPRDDEVFPARIGDARKLLDRLADSRDHDLAEDRQERPPYAGISVRGGNVTTLASSRDLRPGDQIVLDARTHCFTERVVDPDGTERATDVSQTLDDPAPGEVILRVDAALWGENADPVLNTVGDLLRGSPGPVQLRRALAGVLRGHENQSKMVQHAISLLESTRWKDVDIVPFWDEETLRRFVVVDQRKAVSDDGARQTWTPAEEPPKLDTHAKAVAERARHLAELVGLSVPLVEALELAGLHHDDGKVDLRFQREALGWDGTSEFLAKSYKGSAYRTVTSTLPARWRHEQLSVVKTALAIQPDASIDRKLVLRLVGTSHGYGRVSFPHSAQELGPFWGERSEDESEVARALYDRGQWDDLVERTHREYGVWGVAYLEALLRAADGQVSGEGS